jgi:endonuclease/exonuclease/phosphatase family metal-dependent hydrolase
METRVVSINAHFGALKGEQRTMRTRAYALRAVLMSLGDIGRSVILIQEGCSTLVHVLAHSDEHVPNTLKKTHRVVCTPRPGPFLITLVPHCYTIDVRPVTFPETLSKMQREAHVCTVARANDKMLIIHTHLESCGDNEALRGAQVSFLMGHMDHTKHNALFIVGDLNGFGLGGWEKQHMAFNLTVDIKPRRLASNLTPHKLFEFTVKPPILFEYTVK